VLDRLLGVSSISAAASLRGELYQGGPDGDQAESNTGRDDISAHLTVFLLPIRQDGKAVAAAVSHRCAVIGIDAVHIPPARL
jgi:hypothetical protein